MVIGVHTTLRAQMEIMGGDRNDQTVEPALVSALSGKGDGGKNDESAGNQKPQEPCSAAGGEEGKRGWRSPSLLCAQSWRRHPKN